MATVTTTVEPELIALPFQTVPERVSELSYFPRRKIEASSIGATIPASGVGDNQQLLINVALPRSYAYVLVDAQIRIYSATGSFSWAASIAGAFIDAVQQAARTKFFSIEFVSSNEITFSGTPLIGRIYTPASIPGTVLLPANAGEQDYFQASIYNNQANDGAYTADVYAHFLEYDVAQALHVWANAPIPTRHPR